MKRKRQRATGKRFRIAKYSALTVFLTGLVVTGYYLVSSGVIFGKLSVKENTYNVSEDAISMSDTRKIVVTPQNQADAVPLTSENDKLPKIPSVKGAKATKDNPYVVLEIVPELSQQMFSYLVDSEEKGLPFNPVDLGIQCCNEKSNERGFLTQDGTQIDQNNAKNNIVPKDYGYFEGNFQGDIRVSGDTNPDKQDEYLHLPYYEIDFLFNLEISSGEITKEEFEQKSVHDLLRDHPQVFADAYPDQITTKVNDDGKTVAVFKDRSLGFAMEEKDRNGNYTDRNWMKKAEESKNVVQSYKLSIPTDSKLTDVDFFRTPIKELASDDKYKNLFEKDDSGKEIPANILEKDWKWKREKQDVLKKTGYFVNVGKGKGKYTISGNFDGTNTGLLATRTGTDTDMWDYVDKTDYPSDSRELTKKCANNRNTMKQHLCSNKNAVETYYNDSFVGEYFKANQYPVTIRKGMYVYQYPDTEASSGTYSLTIPADAGLSESDFQSMTMEQLRGKYPDLFKNDDNGTEIPAGALADDSKWTKEKTKQTKQFTTGYFVKVEKGKGEYTLSGYNPWTNDNKLTVTKTGTDTDMWNYVDSEDYPDAAKEVDKYYESEKHNIDNKLRQEGDEGTYIKLSYKLHDENQYNIWTEGRYAEQVFDVFAFNYGKYVFTLQYAGLKINDILKYGLFIRDSYEDYENLYVQVIPVTPEMINEMDANDTETTLDYIERADMIYIGEYNNGYGLTATDIFKFASFWEKYTEEGTGKEFQQSDQDSLKTFSDNDLEWWDCLKMLNRLSSSRNLPCILTKLVGSEATQGVDGTQNIVQYIHGGKQEGDGSWSIAPKKCESGKGVINNIGKFTTIVSQFNLLDRKKDNEVNLPPGDPSYRRTFMDDVLPSIKVMKLNEDQQCNSKYPAQYTGYFERIPLVDCDHGHDQAYKERCYYCWNKFTFVPTDLPAEIWGSGMDNAAEQLKVLAEKYGFLPTYFYENALQNPDDPQRGTSATGGATTFNGQNVTFVRDYGMYKKDDGTIVGGDGQNDNINMSLPTNKSILAATLELARNIGNTIDGNPNDLVVSLQNNKKYYTRMKNDQVLLDYSNDASYRDDDIKIDLKVNFTDRNNEDAVIRKITLVKSEGDEDGKTLGLKQEITNTDADGAATTEIKTVNKEPVANSDGLDIIQGYRIMAGNSLIGTIPFKLSDWKDGYTTVRIDWTTRMSVEAPTEKMFFSKEGTSYIHIGERALSNLE